jgi:hypothetical protein
MSSRLVQRRKPNHKSQRRVKCDEQQPACLRCRNKGAGCQYTRSNKIHGTHDFALMPETSSSKGIWTNNNTLEVRDRTKPPIQAARRHSIITFQLQAREESQSLCSMDFWYTLTCFSFTVEHAPFLRDRVTTQAKDCDFLMDALLATTSLHQAHESTNKARRKDLVVASLQHQNRAIGGLKQTLTTLSLENCDDVFLDTVLMLLCAFASSVMPATQTTSATDIVIGAHHFLQGAQIIGMQCFTWLFEGQALRLFGVD